MPPETELTSVSPLLIVNLTSRPQLDMFQQKFGGYSISKNDLLVMRAKPLR
jgi:hypothetical protein